MSVAVSHDIEAPAENILAVCSQSNESLPREEGSLSREQLEAELKVKTQTIENMTSEIAALRSRIAALEIDQRSRMPLGDSSTMAGSVHETSAIGTTDDGQTIFSIGTGAKLNVFDITKNGEDSSRHCSILDQVRHRRFTRSQERSMSLQNNGRLDLSKFDSLARANDDEEESKDSDDPVIMPSEGSAATSSSNKNIDTHDQSTAGEGKCTNPSPSSKKKRSRRRTRRPSLSDFESSKVPVFQLPRGGIYVKTSKGPVQFGIPPETIKDSMTMGLDVPSYFVIPKERFNLKLGLNMCEVEFPAYFSFFIKQASVNMICTPEVEQTVRKIIDETLEGPLPNQLYVDQEYPEHAESTGRFSYEARPDLEKEINFFKEPRNGREIKTDNVMQFTHFYAYDEVKHKVSDEVRRVVTAALDIAHRLIDQQEAEFLREQEKQAAADRKSKVERTASVGAKRRASGMTLVKTKTSSNFAAIPNIYVATLANGLEIIDLGEEYVIVDEDTTVAVVQTFMSTWAPSPRLMDGIVPVKITEPPQFGVTVLGSSHGFDPKGSTSGFVLWMHNKGIMVDPPPNATEILQAAGIIPSMINGIILTHCHSDHDAGTFQKILKEGRITLITTQTIFDSFIRKYSMISGFAAPFLLRLFEPRIVKIGELVHWGGGTLRFFYSLHALPCIGFEAMLAGKRFVYSADTYYEPEGLMQLRDKGYLSEKRCQALIDFPWDYDVVLHEAGIPPIHTPVAALEKLPESVKENLYIIHIAESAAAQTSLKHAQPGVENTIVIETPRHEHATSANILQLLRSTDIFRHFTISQASDMLQLCRHCVYNKGDYICKAGEVGTHFFVILTGFCTVKLSKSLGEGKDLHKDLAKSETESQVSVQGSEELLSSQADLSEDGRVSARSNFSDASTSSEDSEYNVQFGDQTKIFGSGDYLGELALLTANSIRSADIVALTRLTLIKLDRHAFRYLLDTTPGLQYRMERLSKIRCSLSWKAIGANSVLSRMVSTQRSQLQSFMQVMHVKKGTRLWTKGQPVTRAFLLADGKLEFEEMRQELVTSFKTGAFFISISSMMAQRLEAHSADDSSQKRMSKKRKSLIASKLTLVAKTDADLYYIEAEDMLEFLESNPGILIQVIESVVLE